MKKLSPLHWVIPVALAGVAMGAFGAANAAVLKSPHVPVTVRVEHFGKTMYCQGLDVTRKPIHLFDSTTRTYVKSIAGNAITPGTIQTGVWIELKEIGAAVRLSVRAIATGKPATKTVSHVFTLKPGFHVQRVPAGHYEVVVLSGHHDALCKRALR